MASPSSPSVRFTALLVAVMISQIRMITTTVGRMKLSKSRMKERCCEAGILPRSSARAGERARIPKTTPTTVWPIILALLRSPRLRCFTILMKSSTNPTRPIPTKRKSSSRAEAEGMLWVISLATKYPMTVAAMMTTPPIVGVPRLVWWVVGPSSRISWP